MNGVSIREEIRNVFRKPNNAVNQIIFINVVAWLVLMSAFVFLSMFKLGDAYDTLVLNTHLSADPMWFFGHPWELVTYFFLHSTSDILHIVFNLLLFYWFGRLLNEYLSSNKVISVYVLGGLAGGLIYMFGYNFIPYFAEMTVSTSIDSLAQMSTESLESLLNAVTKNFPFQKYQALGDSEYRQVLIHHLHPRPVLVGASAAVHAIMVATAVYLPHYRFRLMFLGSVRVIHIVAVFVILSYLRTVSGTNPGGNLAHLGGDIMGFVYIKALHGGTDLGRWIIVFINNVRGLFIRRAKMKVSYKASAKSSSSSKKTKSTKGSKTSGRSNPSQSEIDIILDKISHSGYESLTKEEKQKLFNASKN